MDSPRFMCCMTDQEGTLLGYTFWCPGCYAQVGLGYHNVYVVEHGKQKATWVFDGNLDAPTFSPSILTRYPHHKDGQDIQVVCHLHLRRGQIEYCGDCTHPLAGQTVPMGNPPW